MRYRRLSILLLAATVVLLASIALGNVFGGRVIGRIGSTLPIAVITPIPVAEPTGTIGPPDWKRSKVMAVATDPGFPDPRVTPRPSPTPEPTPEPTPTPSPIPTPNFDEISPAPDQSDGTGPGLPAAPGTSPSGPSGRATFRHSRSTATGPTAAPPGPGEPTPPIEGP
ncbi:MAG: hypothetical protein ACREM6_09060 [Vulcanimicrobiaceae bacterium]